MQPPAHFLVGAATCRYVRWPALGLVLAFASHFLLDAIPHFEDPSILPGWLAPIAGANWGLALWGTHLFTVVLAVIVWLRFRGATRSGRLRVAYLIGGGLLACTPDWVFRLWDPGGVVGYLNTEAHRWWFMPYIRAVHSHAEWRPTIAFACITAELIVCGMSAWLLFRGTRGAAEAVEEPDRSPASAPSRDGEPTGEARRSGLPEREQPPDRC